MSKTVRDYENMREREYPLDTTTKQPTQLHSDGIGGTCPGCEDCTAAVPVSPVTAQPSECPTCGSRNPYDYKYNCLKNADGWHRANWKSAAPVTAQCTCPDGGTDINCVWEGHKRAAPVTGPDSREDWMTVEQFADKFGYDLTRLSQLSPRILEFCRAFADYTEAKAERLGFAHGEAVGRTALEEQMRQLAELKQKVEFHGYIGEDDTRNGCGHSKWNSRGDCVTCLSFAIDSLNKTLAREREAKTKAESETRQLRELLQKFVDISNWNHVLESEEEMNALLARAERVLGGGKPE